MAIVVQMGRWVVANVMLPLMVRRRCAVIHEVIGSGGSTVVEGRHPEEVASCLHTAVIGMQGFVC